jgi:hypothetical protein
MKSPALVPLLVFVSGNEFALNYGRPTIWSWSLCLLTLAFAVLTFTGLAVQLVRARDGCRRPSWWHALLSSLASLTILVYLQIHGWVGLRTWVY